MEDIREPIRIAQIIGKWLGGGVEAVVMNYYRNIDRSKIQFDFICDDDSTNIPYDEIEKLGGKVILIPPYQKVLKYHMVLKKVLKDGNYKIVHSHINTLSVFSLFAAKCAKVPVRIAHSHSTTNKKEYKKNIIKIVLRPFTKLVATNYMACTEHAGRWMFGDKNFNSGKVYVLNNAIDIDNFKYNEKVRNAKRKELKISDNTFVVGHVGRFVEQKNHRFLIDIFNEIYRENNNSMLLLVGQGPLVMKMKEKVKNLNLENNVLFIGQREEVKDLYQVMDLFLFPSLYEGLGMVIIEAQASGLSCVVSTEVPSIVKMSDDVVFVELKKNASEWLKFCKLKNKTVRNDNLELIERNGYSITREADKIENYYFNVG